MSNYSSHITPVIPLINTETLREKSVEVLRITDTIAYNFHPETVKIISSLTIKMNSYYSNLIEGNNTTPAEIDKALENKFSKDPVKRSLELEHVAHINVQKKIEMLLEKDKDYDICTISFIKMIHRDFYEHIPEEFRIIKDPEGKPVLIEPGEFRKYNVIVGNHIPIDYRSIDESMDFFCNSYKISKYNDLDKLTAAASSHHRLAYIHPFADGNGRTARLFTHAFLIKAGINSRDLWSVSRGFARNRNLYYSMLANADEKRLNDTDGRGNLSEKRLYDFCLYFNEVISDQVKFMGSLFEFPVLFERIKNYIDRNKDLKPESFNILKETILNGKIKRGDIAGITGLSERTARRELKKLIDKGLLSSESPKGTVKISFPSSVLEYYFPKLYPAM